MTDRAFTVAFGISLGVHLVLLVCQLVTLPWAHIARARTPLEVIYEYEIAQQEARRLQDQLARVKRDAASSLTAPGASNPREGSRIRIPERPMLSSDRLPDLGPAPASVVDLTNLVEAARGDPVMLSYFSAIREQIQRTANHRTWLTGEEREGLVYVSFVLTSTGAIQEASIVSSRSADSSSLRDVAVQIVKASSPFPPFPPSMGEPNKTIVVPLEFLLGS